MISPGTGKSFCYPGESLFWNFQDGKKKVLWEFDEHNDAMHIVQDLPLDVTIFNSLQKQISEAYFHIVLYDSVTCLINQSADTWHE